ncbi:MAG: protein kinase [Gemmataceae bacterium]
MSPASSLLSGLSEAAVWRLEQACSRFEQSWRDGGRPDPWGFLGAAGEAERLALLRELLRLDVFYRRRAGEEPTAAVYGARPGDESVVREALAGTAAAEALGDTIDGPLAPPRTARSEPTGDDSPLVGRYRLIRFHARGGLGEVHVAEDAELSREVALKRMQAEHAADPERVSRFVLEGEVTGGLEHPGVVPVYGRGNQADGRPYYTMRFVRGDTLAATIAGFHADAPARFDSMAFRQLLGRFVAVCQAVAYAHSRGVLHRDLKPSNVMIGPFGETLVLDWGLAKVIGSADGAEGPLRLTGPDPAATLGAVGTPAYMSPEQAACRAGELGPATDVYGLGATLYEMLTGAAPFKGNLLEVLTGVVAGSWTPPAQANRAVPPPLDAVCRKAMALRPADRYGSPLELAKDLEAWLADEPVAAYPEPWGARLRRWARKRPGQVSGAVVLLMAAVVGLTLGTFLLERSKRKAEDSYLIAKEGVHRFLDKVSEDVLLEEPATRPLRYSLLVDAAYVYEGFNMIRPDDPDVRQQLAEVFRLRGGLAGEAGRLPEARACLARAVESYEELCRARPEDLDLSFGLSRCCMWQAELQARLGEPGKAIATVSRSVELLSGLLKLEPNRFPVLDLLGRCLDLRATAHGQRGDLAAALRDSLEALEMFQQTVGENLSQTRQHLGGMNLAFGPDRAFAGAPKDPFSLVGMQAGLRPAAYATVSWTSMRPIASAMGNKGSLLLRSGWPAESALAFQEAVDYSRYLTEQYQGSGRLRQELALARLGAGRAEVELGRPTDGEQDLRAAVAVLERLVEQAPDVAEYQGNLSRARGFLGECLYVAGRHKAAGELLREAVRRAEMLPRAEGREHPLHADYPRFLRVLGSLEADSGRAEEVSRLGRLAEETLRRALARTPGEPSLASELISARELLVGQRVERQRQILRNREELAARAPQASLWRSEASVSAAALAWLLLQAARTREALEVVEKALPAQEELARADQQRWERGEGRARQHARETGLELLAVVMPRRAVAPSLKLRSQLAELLACRAAALAATGDGAAAAGDVARAVTLSEEVAAGNGCYVSPPFSWPSVWSMVAVDLLRRDPEPCHQLHVARHLALASTLPESGVADPVGRAVQALRALADSGFDNPRLLEQDGRLAPLRGRQDFQDLLRRLRAQAAVRSAASRQPQRGD